MFLEKCRQQFPELRAVGVDNLMYVKEDLIMPHVSLLVSHAALVSCLIILWMTTAHDVLRLRESIQLFVFRAALDVD